MRHYILFAYAQWCPILCYYKSRWWVSHSMYPWHICSKTYILQSAFNFDFTWRSHSYPYHSTQNMSKNKCWDGNKRLSANRTQHGDIDRVAVAKQLRHLKIYYYFIKQLSDWPFTQLLLNKTVWKYQFSDYTFNGLFINNTYPCIKVRLPTCIRTINCIIGMNFLTWFKMIEFRLCAWLLKQPVNVGIVLVAV